MVCQACHQQGISGGVYCSGCGQQFASQAYAAPQPTLFRARQGKVIAGVLRWGWRRGMAGIRFWSGWALVALVLCGVGCGILAYLAAVDCDSEGALVL